MDSCTTSGLGSCMPSAHLLSSQRLPGLLPHLLTAPPFPGHSHGGQAGPQIWAGCKARVISYLLSLFLKINCQGSDPKEKSKYKCIHNRSAPAAKHRETKAPREGTHTTVPRQGSGGGGSMQPELQLWALNSPDTEKRDSRTRCLAHWVYAEGNLKTCQLSFPH